MKKNAWIVLILLLNFAANSQVTGDSLGFKPQFRHGQNYSIQTSIGMVYTGFVTAEDRDFVTIENRITHEKQEIRKSTIVESKILRQSALSSTGPYGPNPHDRNYMLSENAFLFDENCLTMSSHWLLMERFDYAFTENIAASMSTLAFYPYSLGVKTVFQLRDEDYVGGSIFGIGDITSGSGRSWFLGYGALLRYTKGNSNKNLNLSAGFVGVRSDVFFSYQTTSFVNLLIVNGAWCNRFAENVALNVEGWYLPTTGMGLGGFGFKFISDEVNCWTLGCYAFINGNDNGIKLNLKALPLPYFGISRKFD